MESPFPTTRSSIHFPLLWLFLLLTISLGAGCSDSLDQNSWTGFIPKETIALYIPYEGESARMVPQSESAGIFRQPVSGTSYAPDIPYLGVALMADQSSEVSPVWILDASIISTLEEQLTSTPPAAGEPIVLRQNRYLFEGVEITIFGNPTDPSRFYTTQLGDVVILSASPKAVENFITQAVLDETNGFAKLNAQEWRPVHRVGGDGGVSRPDAAEDAAHLWWRRDPRH